jgi:hypothetical protein
MVGSFSKLCGWQEDTQGIRNYARRVGTLRSVARSLLGGPQENVHLWQAILACKPTWRRGSQGIGDCVSWGAELCATSLMATDAVLGQSTWTEEAATESIYGGARVEALNKTRGGKSDGAFGYAAARWLVQSAAGKPSESFSFQRLSYSSTAIRFLKAINFAGGSKEVSPPAALTASKKSEYAS